MFAGCDSSSISLSTDARSAIDELPRGTVPSAPVTQQLSIQLQELETAANLAGQRLL
jgi:hypothetical protein